MKPEVGQTLYWVPLNRHGKAVDVQVTSVGRKWAGLSNGQRINMNTMHADGGSYCSPGRCYTSKAEHDDGVALAVAWDDFRKLVDQRYSRPAGLSIGAIKQMIETISAAS